MDVASAKSRLFTIEGENDFRLPGSGPKVLLSTKAITRCVQGLGGGGADSLLTQSIIIIIFPPSPNVYPNFSVI